MARQKDKVYLPMGGGGLMRYQEEAEEMLVIKPNHLVALVVGIIIFEIVIKLFVA